MKQMRFVRSVDAFEQAIKKRILKSFEALAEVEHQHVCTTDHCGSATGTMLFVEELQKFSGNGLFLYWRTLEEYVLSLMINDFKIKWHEPQIHIGT